MINKKAASGESTKKMIMTMKTQKTTIMMMLVLTVMMEMMKIGIVKVSETGMETRQFHRVLLTNKNNNNGSTIIIISSSSRRCNVNVGVTIPSISGAVTTSAWASGLITVLQLPVTNHWS